MKQLAPLALLAAACAADPAAGDFSPADEPSLPDPDGKSDDPRACGTGGESCVPRLCGYDCSTRGEQCTERCAPTAGRADAFVAATITGAATARVDSRDTPYDEVFGLDNVLVYGCELWDFSDQASDGLAIRLKQLRHSSFVVDPNDPSTYDANVMVYVGAFTGPGSYRGEGLFEANQDAPRFHAQDSCAVDIAATASGGVEGTFDCRLDTLDMRGEFHCPIDAMSPIFSRWTPAPL